IPSAGGKNLEKLDDDRKRERDAYFEQWVSHALADDSTNATLFREEYNTSGDARRNDMIENVRTYFSQSNVVRTVATKMRLQLKVQRAMVFSASSHEEQNLQRAVAEAFDIDYLDPFDSASRFLST
ncbi:5710_t:CDS:1, partial [Paraglomus occultum]